MQSLDAAKDHNELLPLRTQTTEKKSSPRDGAQTTRIRIISLTLLAGVFLSMTAMVWCFGDSRSGDRIDRDSKSLKSIRVHMACSGNADWKRKVVDDCLLPATKAVQKWETTQGCVSAEVSLAPPPFEARGAKVRRAVSASRAQKTVLIPLKDDHKHKRRCFTCL